MPSAALPLDRSATETSLPIVGAEADRPDIYAAVRSFLWAFDRGHLGGDLMLGVGDDRCESAFVTRLREALAPVEVSL